ncbi:hypothetical protein [Candidatus Poriferisodalis sp.]|uniref:hypothetical protein n=1 Tax=Candidatus Poriferisodalis sp. TaxID=3101277 RepID=UPI003B5BB531
MADEEQEGRYFGFEEGVPDGGVYSNYVQASYTRHEFTLDFVVMPSSFVDCDGTIVGRLKLTPAVADDLVAILAQATIEHREAYGGVPRPSEEGERPDAN